MWLIRLFAYLFERPVIFAIDTSPETIGHYIEKMKWFVKEIIVDFHEKYSNSTYIILITNKKKIVCPQSKTPMRFSEIIAFRHGLKTGIARERCRLNVFMGEGFVGLPGFVIKGLYPTQELIQEVGEYLKQDTEKEKKSMIMLSEAQYIDITEWFRVKNA